MHSDSATFDEAPGANRTWTRGVRAIVFGVMAMLVVAGALMLGGCYCCGGGGHGHGGGHGGGHHH